MYNAKTIKTKIKKDGTFSKVPDVYYKCASCGELHKRSNVEVDHISPVGGTPGWPPQGEEWDVWLNRLFCEVENLQVICKPCHYKKSALERKVKNV